MGTVPRQPRPDRSLVRYAPAELEEVPRGTDDTVPAVEWPFNEETPVTMSRRRVRKMVRSPLKEVMYRVMRALYLKAPRPRGSDDSPGDSDRQ